MKKRFCNHEHHVSTKEIDIFPYFHKKRLGNNDECRFGSRTLMKLKKPSYILLLFRENSVN